MGIQLCGVLLLAILSPAPSSQRRLSFHSSCREHLGEILSTLAERISTLRFLVAKLRRP